MARATTFRGVTGYVEEIAFFMALRTDVGRCSRCDGIATFVALPVRQAATWANIPNEFTRRRVAAQGALHVSFTLFHLIYLYFSVVLIGRTFLRLAVRHSSLHRKTYSRVITSPHLGHFFSKQGLPSW
jgi:hypothetical protein